MPALVDTQAAFRAAIATTGTVPILSRLRAPADAEERLGIYRRHFRESFRRHLRGRYPTLEWLLGTDRMIALADTTLQRRPPRAPSLAEYGAEFIDTVAAASDLPAYLVDVARLDWNLGRLAVSVDHPPQPIGVLASCLPDQLESATLVLQPGHAFIASDWPVDTLVHLHLQGTAPDALSFAPDPVQLQLRGARGQFTLERLSTGVFAFRRSLAASEPLGAAIAAALAADPDFNLSEALAMLFATGLVIALSAGDTP